MPEVTLDTPTGIVRFNYVISTPTVASAPSIDPAIPTVLFLHPVYLGKIIYHPQFADRDLRRFNLIALDLRCHARTIGKVGKGYGREVAAWDVALFMVRLRRSRSRNIMYSGCRWGAASPCRRGYCSPHLCSRPSSFLLSPLTEPPDVGEGRQEIYDYWAEGVRRGGNHRRRIDDGRCDYWLSPALGEWPSTGIAGDILHYIVLEENNGVMHQGLSPEYGHDASRQKTYPFRYFPACARPLIVARHALARWRCLPAFPKMAGGICSPGAN
ncbi:AB hydrolase-1 domain-containing protein [Mycena venus]|uniref:AB hydrolase-1 domain-containing protein n=1 Tax=Mycena venus TaxID=2733690 RepID=A0A8H6Y986_9AGAR|nr:AB hydrolase-1 domain-containing protein [Mycena venus]